ncbi:MAG: STAS domain-containing protein [Chloroflexota bacterium]|jgi:anti-sigma B factor antagonist
MTESSLDIEVQTFRRADMVTVAGRVDSNTASELDQALKQVMDGGRHNLIVNLAGVNYLSSAGLRSLVAALRECKRQRGDVLLVSPSERVLEVLRLAGLDTLFTFYDDETEAVGSF